MHLLPTNLGTLADVADRKRAGGRLSLDAVHLRLHEDNTFTAEATDTRMLVRVSGPCVAPPEDYPDHAGMKAAPNGRADALIPLDSWKKAFATVGKVTRRVKTGPLASVAVKLGAELATFGATNLDSYPVEQTRLVEGKFPPADDIINRTRKQPERDRVVVDPVQFADALRALAAFTTDDECGVEIRTYGPGKALYLRPVAGTGLDVHAVMMPLAGEKEEKNETAEEDEKAGGRRADKSALVSSLRNQVAELQGAVKPLEEENARLAAERNRLAEQFAEAVRQLEVCQANARGLAEDRDRLQAANAELVKKVGDAAEDRRQMDVIRGWLGELGPRLRGEKGGN